MEHKKYLQQIDELIHCQRKLEYCRQILVDKQDFTPIQFYQLISTDCQDGFDFLQFKDFAEKQLPSLKTKEIKVVFKYLQGKKLGAKSIGVGIKQLVDALIPISKTHQRKQFINREPKRPKPSLELLYAFKRLLLQIVENEIRLEQLGIFRQQLLDAILLYSSENTVQANREQVIRQYLLTKEKFLKQQQIRLLLKTLNVISDSIFPITKTNSQIENSSISIFSIYSATEGIIESRTEDSKSLEFQMTKKTKLITFEDDLMASRPLKQIRKTNSNDQKFQITPSKIMKPQKQFREMSNSIIYKPKKLKKENKQNKQNQTEKSLGVKVVHEKLKKIENLINESEGKKNRQLRY